MSCPISFLICLAFKIFSVSVAPTSLTSYSSLDFPMGTRIEGAEEGREEDIHLRADADKADNSSFHLNPSVESWSLQTLRAVRGSAYHRRVRLSW